jgi:hypothetical protein
MKILLIELETKGHHISSYIRSIVHNLVNKNKKIILLTTSEIKKKDYYSYLRKNTKIIFTKKIKQPVRKDLISLLKFQFNYYKIIKNEYLKIIKTNEVNLIYINTLDFFDKALAILGSPFNNTKFLGLFINPKFYDDYKINIIKKLLYEYFFNKILKIKNLKGIFLIDPICFNYLNKKKIKNWKKVNLLNDMGSANKIKKFKYNKEKCRKILGIKKEHYVILVYGYLRENKALKELFTFINYIDHKKKIKILIVGKRDKETKKFIDNEIKTNTYLKNIIINIDKYADDIFEKIVFTASDLTWTGYKKTFNGSSGVFFLSSLNKRPVITSNHGVIGWYSKKFKIGVSTDLDNKKQLVKILNELIKNKNKIKYNFDHVNLKHSFSQFGYSITKKMN